MAAPYLCCPNGAVEIAVALVRPMVLVLVVVATVVAFVAGLFVADETVAVAVILPTGYPIVEPMEVAAELDFLELIRVSWFWFNRYKPTSNMRIMLVFLDKYTASDITRVHVCRPRSCWILCRGS